MIIIFTGLTAIFTIFLLALVWQNDDGTSGIGWIFDKIRLMLNAKNIIIAILVFLLVIVVRMFQVGMGANENLIREIDKYEQFSKDKTQELTQLKNRVDNFLKEHKRAEKYFE